MMKEIRHHGMNLTDLTKDFLRTLNTSGLQVHMIVNFYEQTITRGLRSTVSFLVVRNRLAVERLLTVSLSASCRW